MSFPADENAPFRHYTRRHQVIAWISQHLLGEIVYTNRHGLIEGLRRKGGFGWVPAALTGAVETPEDAFWQSCDLAGKVVYDVGSFEGILAMFFARQARTVVCFEPNDRNRRRLTENLELNGFQNVIVRPVGISSSAGRASMVYSPLMSGGASIERTAADADRAAAHQAIELSTIDSEVASGLPVPDFIKIDTEGCELEALQGAAQTIAQHRPELFLEMHGNTVREKKEKVAAIVEHLERAGYSILHVESGAEIRSANSDAAMEGHLFAKPR